MAHIFTRNQEPILAILATEVGRALGPRREALRRTRPNIVHPAIATNVTAPERISMLIAAVVGSAYAWYIHSLGLMRPFLDQTAHLNLARQAVDSITPGLSQIGFWPPLLHLGLMPFVWFDGLYRSGFAGTLLLVPCLVLAVFFLHRTICFVSGSAWLASFGALSLAFNPYVLYYSVTPMMEVLFIAMLAGVIYFFSRWFVSDRLEHLLATGLFVALASVARFEGLLLIPFTGLLVLAKLVTAKKPWREIESLMLLFSLLAILGAGAILAYSAAYGAGPLEFARGNWSASAQQRAYELPAAGSTMRSLAYLAMASSYMLGKFILALAGLGLGIALALLKRRQKILIAILAAIAGLPFLVLWITVYKGVTVLYLPDLAPFKGFYNERYGLALAVLAALGPAWGAHALFGARYPNRTLKIAGSISAIGLLAGVVWTSSRFFYKTVAVERFSILKNSSQRYPDQLALARDLRGKYDRGKILITRALYDFTVIESGIPLKQFIQESNYPYFDRALDEPWLYARWVIMIKPDNTAYYSGVQIANERISLKWYGTATLRHFYTLESENGTGQLYKINETAVEQYALEYGLKANTIPSLNPATTTLDPPERGPEKLSRR